MNTRILMTSAAIAQAILGLIALFAPQELLTCIGVTPAGFLPSLVQLLAATLLGLAMTDWMAKDSKIGGIYLRPIAIGNFLNFAIGAITLIKFAIHGHPPLFAIVAAVVYTVFAVAFAVVVFRG
ncbi:MAG: hypothetical protein ACRD3J_18230 [Thermoanaerobaculia bacterium]